MAVVLKEAVKEVKKENLRLAPKQEDKKIQYEFPYDDMYLLYDYILKEMKTKK
ncbi:MAG: hypothetical protein ACN4A7_09205 [Thermacetogeniaceae bacterium]|jgi:hypothetical protein|nr:hypothetical protein [Thermoanaerobacterales bacterium]NLN22032.1 hypothetical protein [Syntrophomonadaceae bacterium]